MEIKQLSTKCGQLIGLAYADGFLFSGVPYANARRFEMPVPVTKFSGTFDGTKKPVEFPQMSTYTDDSGRFYTKEFRRGETFVYSENPLTMNIITPKEGKKCPVLLYIHGGAFAKGKMSEHPMGTSFEYARRGIILVNISYRLNVFGLYRSENYYLYDQLCAINWVKDNIESFGGNPEDITLIGQSAGAMSIFQLLYTDRLKGIIKGAVMMSGAGFFPSIANGYTKEEGKWFWDRVMEKAGCSTDEELKDTGKVSTEALWHAWTDAKKEKDSLHLFMPGIDGKLIYAQPSEIKKSGKMLDIPLMIGVTAQDMIAPVILFNMMTDFAAWSEKLGRSPVYTYYFDHVLPGNLYRAYHASDLWYVFGNMDKCWRPWKEEDYRLKDTMIDAVESFVRSGSPGWEPFTKKNKCIRRFNTFGPETVRPGYCYKELLINTTLRRGPL